MISVIEKLDELDQILRVAARRGATAAGHSPAVAEPQHRQWADSGGEDAKFGLNTAQLMAALERLRAEGWRILASAAFPHRVAGTGYSHRAQRGSGAARF